MVGDVHRHHVANGPVVDSLDRLALGLFVAVAIPGAQPGAVLLRDPGGLDHRLDAGHVHGHRLLAEDVLAGLDGGAQVERAEPGRGTQQHHIDALEQLLVPVEPVEAAVGGDIDPGGDIPALPAVAQRPEAVLETIHEHVAQGDELGVLVGPQGLDGGLGAAPAAANKPDAEGLVRGSVGTRENDGGSGGRRGGRLEERPAGGGWGHEGASVGKGDGRPERVLCRPPAGLSSIFCAMFTESAALSEPEA
jgi:hypothetical protein